MKKRILIFWEGIPVCGLLISELYKSKDISVDLYSTTPNVPFKNFFKSYQIYPKVIKKNTNIKIDVDTYDAIIATGWNNSFWNRICKLAKKKNITTCIVVDNNFQLSFRQILGAFYFRAFLKKNYDYAFCPGVSSSRLLSFLGMKKTNIITGSYGAFSKLYFYNKKILKKNKFIYVGQLIHRKGVHNLISAFNNYQTNGGKWSLEIIGSGKLRKVFNKRLSKIPNLSLQSFLQPKEIAQKLMESKVLVLPSLKEHWGTVVCEAAACGCTLLLSKEVGSQEDLLRNGINGTLFNPKNISELEQKLFLLENLDYNWYKQSSKVSVSIAIQKNEVSYANAIRYMLNDKNL